MSRYQVIVGNVGTVYDGDSRDNAHLAFEEYVAQSRNGYGRAAGESVALMLDDLIEDEFVPGAEAPDRDDPGALVEDRVNAKMRGLSEALGTLVPGNSLDPEFDTISALIDEFERAIDNHIFSEDDLPGDASALKEYRQCHQHVKDAREALIRLRRASEERT
jgi:hypothetical protein